MIKAFIFDLDGTLVQTEKLKALSYARAALELCPHDLSESEVVEAFKDVVGLSRQEVATSLIERFHLSEKATEYMDTFGVSTPWQVYVQIRLKIYREMVADPKVILENQWPHTMGLLNQAREARCQVGLATMSYCEQVQRVLEILELTKAFDFVATRDDVENGKPDPEMYLLVADQLNVQPSECLAIEDSPAGVQAAIHAGMQVVAVSTPFTRDRLHSSKLIPAAHIVDTPVELKTVVDHVVAHANN